MASACTELGVSQQKACQSLNQSRIRQRYELRLPVKDAALIEAIHKQIEKRPRFGYRRITVELRKDHWIVNFKRVYRIWHDKGSRHEQKEVGQPKRADAPIVAACSGCIPAGPYPCRDTESIGYKTGECKRQRK